MRPGTQLLIVSMLAVSFAGPATADITLAYDFLETEADSGGLLLPDDTLSFVDHDAWAMSEPGYCSSVVETMDLSAHGVAALDLWFDGARVEVSAQLIDLQASLLDPAYSNVFAQGYSYFQFWLMPRDRTYEYNCTIDQGYDGGLVPAFLTDGGRALDLFVVIQGVGATAAGIPGGYYFSGVLPPGDYQCYGGIRAAALSDGEAVGPFQGHVNIQIDLLPVPEDFTWIGPNGGSFGEPSHWDPSGPPGVDGRAVFNAPADADQTVAFSESHHNARLLVTSPPGQDNSSLVVFDLNGNTYTLEREWSAYRGPSSVIGHADGGNARMQVTDGTVDARDCDIAPGGYGELSVSYGGLWSAFQHYISVGARGSGLLAVFNGGRIEHGHGYAGQFSEGSGTIWVDGVDPALTDIPSTWLVTGWFGLGMQGWGELMVMNGGRAEIGKCDMATDVSGAGASAQIWGQGARWELSSPWETSLIVGQRGYAEVDVWDGGSVLSQGDTHLGEEPDATGLLLLQHAGRTAGGDRIQTFECMGDLVVGQGGSGELQILDDAWVTVHESLTVGTDPNAVPDIASSVTVEGEDSLLEVLGTYEDSHVGLEVGRSGAENAMAIRYGGEAVVEYIATVGGSDGSAGTLEIEGESSQMVARFQLEVGRDGPGEVMLTDGGKLFADGTITDPTIGENYKGLVFVGLRSTGLLTVSGTGEASPSILESIAQLSLGSNEGGDGTLIVEQGGLVVSYMHTSATETAGIIGRGVGGKGHAIVRDVGSLWEMPNGGVTVGWYGTGDLSILDGGLVVSQHGIIGRLTEGQGQVTVRSDVDGTESRWEIEGPLAIGGDLAGNAGGQAVVSVGSQGWISCSDAVTIHPVGTLEFTDGGLWAGAGTTLHGTIRGSGSMDSPVTNVDGVLHPSDLGTGLGRVLTLNGEYVQQVDGTLWIDVDRDAGSGKLDLPDIPNAATLGGRLKVCIPPGQAPEVGSTFEIVYAAGGVINTFDSYDLPMIEGGPVFEVRYDTYAVTLETVREYRCKADLDHDKDVDADDLAIFTPCAAGPAVPVDESCRLADFDGDDDVDMIDFAVYQRCHSGAGNPADPACVE